MFTSVPFFRHGVQPSCDLANAKGVRLNRTDSMLHTPKLEFPDKRNDSIKTFAPSDRLLHQSTSKPSSSSSPTFSLKASTKQRFDFTYQSNGPSASWNNDQRLRHPVDQRTMGFIQGRTSKQTSRVKTLLRLALSRLAAARRPRLARKSISRSDVGQLLALGHIDRALHRVRPHPNIVYSSLTSRPVKWSFV
jgi:hypothetical protein